MSQIDRAPRDAVHVGDGDALNGEDALVRRAAALHGERLRPRRGETGDRRPLDLRPRDRTPFGGFDELAVDPRGGRFREHRAKLAERRRRALVLRKRDHREAETRLRQRTERKSGLEHFAGRHQLLEIAPLARERRGEHLRGRVVRIVVAGEAKRDDGETVRQIRGEGERARCHRPQLHGGPRGQRLPRDRAEQGRDLCQRRRRIDLARDDQDRVVRRIPRVVELLQHRSGGPLERGARAERVVRVRRALEECVEQLRVELVLGIREVLRDFLLDRPALLSPRVVGVQDVAHANCFDPQRDVEILRGDGEDVLRHRLLRRGVEVAAERGAHVRELRRGEIRAAAEHHVLQRMRHAREPRRRLVRAREIGHADRDDRGERVLDDHHPEAVVERCALHNGRRGLHNGRRDRRASFRRRPRLQ